MSTPEVKRQGEDTEVDPKDHHIRFCPGIVTEAGASTSFKYTSLNSV
jgi:hypothetical protein